MVEICQVPIGLINDCPSVSRPSGAVCVVLQLELEKQNPLADDLLLIW